MSWKQRRAADLNSAVNSSISFCAALACSSRLAARSASLFASADSIQASLRSKRPVSRADAEPRRVDGVEEEARTLSQHHSIASMWPSRSVSSTASVASRREGTSRFCRFGSPQLTRNLMTFCDGNEV